MAPASKDTLLNIYYYNPNDLDWSIRVWNFLNDHFQFALNYYFMVLNFT